MGVIFTLMLSLVFAIITIYANNVGNYVIEVKETPKNIAISETRDFKEPKTVIYVAGINGMSNIDGNFINNDLITSVDGSSNKGNEYIAHTFYLKNMSGVTVDYIYEIDITDVTKGLDSAMRFRIIKDNEDPITYAKPQEIGNIGFPEPGSEPYESKNKVVKMIERDFESGEIHKYSIVIYLEGNDPQCTNDLFSGTMRMNMKFKIV